MSSDFNIPLLICWRDTENVNIKHLNNTINKLELNAISRKLQTKVEHIVFLTEHRIFTKIEDILDHKTGLNKFKRIKFR